MSNRKFYIMFLYFYTTNSLAVAEAMNRANIGPFNFAIDSAGPQNHYPPIVESILHHFKPDTNSYQSRSSHPSERQSFGDQINQAQTTGLRNTQRGPTIFQHKQGQAANPPATQTETQTFGEFVRLFLSDTILLTFTFSLAMALGFGLVAGLNLSGEMEETRDQVLFINNLSRNTARQVGQAAQAVADITPQADPIPSTFAETFYFTYVCIDDLLARVTQLENEINQIKGSLSTVCNILDDTLDTAADPRDCCITDVSMVCLKRSVNVIAQGTAGVCESPCPTSVIP